MLKCRDWGNKNAHQLDQSEIGIGIRKRPSGWDATKSSINIEMEANPKFDTVFGFGAKNMTQN